MIFKSKNTNLNFKDAVGFLSFKKFENFNFFKCVFSTRLGGISKNEFKSMNFSFDVGDNSENIFENYKLFFKSSGLDLSKIVLSKQKHTDIVKVVTQKDTWDFKNLDKNCEPADALITNTPNLILSTFFADCVPIVILDPTKKVIASVHAGWRGTVFEISKNTILKMQEIFNCRCKDLICLIGPSIQDCCFEVDSACVLKFKNSKINLVEEYILKKENNKYKVSLQGINKQILMDCGIQEKNIQISDICTKCSSDLFFSHRKFGKKRGIMGMFCTLI